MKRNGPDHPKVELLSILLNCGLAQTLGHLELLFHFTAKHAPAGDIGRWPDAMIAKRCGWEEDPNQFIEAMLNAKGPGNQAGWIERHPTHRLILHDWSEHAEDSVHLFLGRRGERFADGSMPKLTRLSKSEREQVMTKYERSACDDQDASDGTPDNSQETHAVHTPCTQETHCLSHCLSHSPVSADAEMGTDAVVVTDQQFAAAHKAFDAWSEHDRGHPLRPEHAEDRQLERMLATLAEEPAVPMDGQMVPCPDLVPRAVKEIRAKGVEFKSPKWAATCVLNHLDRWQRQGTRETGASPPDLSTPKDVAKSAKAGRIKLARLGDRVIDLTAGQVKFNPTRGVSVGGKYVLTPAEIGKAVFE